MNNKKLHIFYNIFFYFTISIIILSLRIPTLFYHYIDWDEASLMSEAWAMTKGQILYKDIYHIHPIFHFFIFIPFFVLLPNTLVPIAIKAFNIIIIFIGAILIKKIVKKIIDDEVIAFLTSIFFTFYLSYFKWTHSAYGEFYILFPILIATNIILTYKQYERNKIITAGVLCGIAFFIKQVAIFDIFSLFIFLIFFNKTSKAKYKTFYFMSGILISVILAFIYPIITNSIDESFQSMFFHNIKSYTSITTNDLISQIISIIIKPLFLLKTFYLAVLQNKLMAFTNIIVFSFAFILIPIKIKSKTINNYLCTLLFVLIWFLINITGISLIGRFYSHYLTQLAITSSLLLALLAYNLPKTLKKIYVIAIAFSFIFLGCNEFKKEIKNDLLNNKQLIKANEITNYIKENSKTNDSIFLFKVEDLNLFYLTELLSPNGIYMFQDMDSTHTGDLKNEILNKNKLLLKPPNILITGPMPTNTASNLEIFFKDFIDNKYTFQKNLYDLNIYFLKKDN